MFSYDERQIESPTQDLRVRRDITLHLGGTALFHIFRGFSAGLHLGWDRTFHRGQVDGAGQSAWELWLAIVARYTFGRYFFAQLGYMPLQVRSDETRTELVNTRGENTGLFLGGHRVAWLFGVGGQLPLSERVGLFARLDFRVRYFGTRGGAALAGERELGGISITPMLGAAYSF